MSGAITACVKSCVKWVQQTMILAARRDRRLLFLVFSVNEVNVPIVDAFKMLLQNDYTPLFSLAVRLN